MSCDQLEQIARQRTAEMRCEAAAARAASGPRIPVRHRAGRALAAIGHRIAADSARA